MEGVETDRAQTKGGKRGAFLLGLKSGVSGADRFMTHVEVAIVGGGPAGLAAAAEAQASGARVLLLEERPILGGRAMVVPGARGLTEGLMRGLGAAEVWRQSTVWNLSGRTLAVLRSGQVEFVVANAVILATGAREVMVPFPGWTLPGVTTLQGGWELLRAGRVAAEASPAVVTGGPESVALALRLAERGVAVVFVGEQRPPGLPDAIRYVPGTVVEAAGEGAVERVVLASGNVEECHLLCVESPRVPAVELARVAGCPCLYHPQLGGVVPHYDPCFALHGPTSRLFIAGDASGVDTPRAAAESGRLAARCALDTLGLLPDPVARIEEARRRLASVSGSLRGRIREAHMLGAPPEEVVGRWDAREETVMCPCEGVTVSDLRAAVEEGAATPDDLKRWTRCGMGSCQWRRCGEPILRWLSAVLGVPVGRLPLPRLRPPVAPVPLGALAGVEEDYPVLGHA